MDLDDCKHFVELSVSDTEDEYYRQLENAPEWAPGWPFPDALRYQGFIGRGDWLLVSDRDGERMHMLLRRRMTPEAMDLIRRLVWGEAENWVG